MTAHNPHIAVMMQAAREAGLRLLEQFRNRDTLLIEYKNPGDLISDADRESEEAIVRILSEAFPDYGMLGEEGADKATMAGGYRWVIDPLDGTSDFLHGIPFWCVTIAMEKAGTVVAGVTYDPVHDELFHAVKDQGAYLNNQKIATKQTNALRAASVSLDIGPPSATNIPLHAKTFAKAFAQCATVMNVRSCALAMAYIAAGRLDLFVNFGKVNPWDTNAGLLLVTEANGIVTDTQGNAVTSQTDNIFCAANSSLHDQFMPLLKE